MNSIFDEIPSELTSDKEITIYETPIKNIQTKSILENSC